METSNPGSEHIGKGMSEVLLKQYLDGALSAEQCHFVERHLLENEMWSDIYEGMQAMQTDSINTQSVQENLADRLAKRLVEEEEPAAVKPMGRRFSIRKIGLMAASVTGLMVMAAVGLNYLGNTTFQESSSAMETVGAEADGMRELRNRAADEVEVMDYVKLSQNKNQRKSNRDVQAAREDELPEELQYKQLEYIKEVANRKRLASGEAKILFADVDKQVLRNNGYRELNIVDAADFVDAEPVNQSRPNLGNNIRYTELSSPKPEVNRRPISSEPVLVAEAPEAKSNNDSEDKAGDTSDGFMAEAEIAEDYAEEVVAAEAPAAPMAAEKSGVSLRNESAKESTDKRSYKKGKAKKPSYAAEVIKANTIAGNITDASGEPLIGASVTVKGKDIGVVTGLEGEYELNGIEEGDEVVISMVGMETITAEAKINEENYFVLESNEPSLDEVVVVGYGRNSKPRTNRQSFERFLASEAETFQLNKTSPKVGRVVLEVILAENGTVSASTVTKGIDAEYNEYAFSLVEEAAQDGMFDGWTKPNQPFTVRVKFKN